MGRVAARPSGRRVVVLLGICIACLAQQQVFSSIPELVRNNARTSKIDPGQFLESIEQKAGDWQAGNEVAGRSEFMGHLRKVMSKSGLHMVVGGQSLGKSKIIKNISMSFDRDYPLLSVNMRLPSKAGSRDALECLQLAAKTKWPARSTPQWVPKWLSVVVKDGLTKAAGAIATARAKQGGRNTTLSAMLFGLEALLKIKEPRDFLVELVNASIARGQRPIIIVDEANKAFPNGNGNGDKNGRKGAAEDAIDTFVAISKEEGKACVILVASEYSFPYRIEQLGKGKYNSLSIILAPEVEEKAMIEVLTAKWGMPQDLAEAFYESFGGDIFLCSQALAKLATRFSTGNEDLFDPYSVRSTTGLCGLAIDPLTREHMEKMADRGWSPVEEAEAGAETPSQRAARIIAKNNVGAVIDRGSVIFDLPFEGEMFKDRNTKQVLIPTTQYMRKCIQVEIEAVKQKEEEAARKKEAEQEAARWKPPWEW